MQNNDHTHPTLKDEISHLRESLKTITTPSKVEHNVMNAFKAHQQHLTSHTSNTTQTWQGQLAQWFAPGAAITVSLGMVAWLLIGGAAIGVKNLGGDVAVQDAPFIALQSLEQIALEPNPRLIETTVPKMLFASMGLAVSPEMASETVRAEMLVSAAGQPLALRLSRP